MGCALGIKYDSPTSHQFVSCSYRGYALRSVISRPRERQTLMIMTISTKPGDKSEKQHAEETDSISDGPNLKGDWFNVFLLTFLYSMQGVPLGFIQVMPIILQSNREYASYKDQALYSLIALPYTLKLSWAPLVDAVYIRKIGRRKSWLIPVQFLIGSWFIYISLEIDDLLPKTGKPNIVKLVCMLSVAMFLVATQDIVVDGWALTMLKKNNIGYASTCNTTGLAIGSLIGSVSSTLFTSEMFCNKYLRITSETGGIVTLKSLLNIWGFMFMSITPFIAIFKKEKDCIVENNYGKLNVFQYYSLLWKVLKSPNMKILAVVLLTVKIGFAATDSVSHFKLIDAGVSKDDMMIISTVIFMMKMILPLFLAKYTSGPQPLNIYIKAILIKLAWNIVFVVLIYVTPKLIKNNNGVVEIPIHYYAMLAFVLSIQEVLSYTMFIAILAFFSRISDPRFGGTYMTLLNTLSNLGTTWCSFLVLGVIDFLTLKECSVDSQNFCSSQKQQNICKLKGGQCMVTINGYYIEATLCTFIGIIWYDIFKKILKKLQTKCPSEWSVNNVHQPNTKNITTVFSVAVS